MIGRNFLPLQSVAHFLVKGKCFYYGFFFCVYTLSLKNYMFLFEC
jgi:hypothetical protein